MKAVAVIPARFGSRRFPGKPLAMILGKPLVQHVYERTARAGTLQEVVVATDDARIRETVLGFGGNCVMTDPGHRSGSDRLGEVAARLEADVLVNVQGDEPLIEPAVIDAVVEVHLGGQPPDIATVAVPLCGGEEFADPHVVKVVTDRQGNALYFSRSGVPHGWRPGARRALRHVGIYAFGREALLRFVALPAGSLERTEDLEQLRALENGMSVRVVELEEFEGVGVDRPEDIERVEEMMRTSRGRGEGLS